MVLGRKSSAAGKRPKMTKEERRKKYTDIARKRRQKPNGRYNKTVCYNCRKPGHIASECTSLGNSTTNINANHSSSTGILCYKCGSTEHSFHNCSKRNKGGRDNLPYAQCFICKERGHLASSCPQNKSGIYVNGGCCRTCGSKQHLVKDCPEKKIKKKDALNEDGDEERSLSIIDNLLEVEPACIAKKETKNDKTESTETKKKRRVVNF